MMFPYIVVEKPRCCLCVLFVTGNNILHLAKAVNNNKDVIDFSTKYNGALGQINNEVKGYVGLALLRNRERP